MSDHKGNRKPVSLIESESDRVQLMKLIYEVVLQFVRSCN
jgi:hypothetical protein